ncbi:MAG: HDOD domain-containing protein [Magnetococcus sp. XQGC-1]
MPTRPTVLLAAVKSQNLFVQSLPEVTEIVLRDMALSARMLQAANTLLPECSRKVESIECALALLGQDRVREVTHELFLSAEITRRESGMQKMRTKGVRAARVVAWLSGALPPISPPLQSGNLPVVPYDEAYVAGLFHDCGQLVLLKNCPEYAELLTAERSETGQTLEEMEEACCQITHAQLGALLCDAWQLPKSLVYLVEAHHRPDAFAGRPVRERKYAVLHAMLALTDWIEGELPEWEWARHRQQVQQLFALDDAALTLLGQRGRLYAASLGTPTD